MTRVLVTGASGFIGSALAPALAGLGFSVRAASRRPSPERDHVEMVRVGELGARHDWSRALAGVDVVVHLAGPAHARSSERELHTAIVEGTAAFAAQAEAAGVTRFLFVSSIKAGEAGRDGYAGAKLAAEEAVLARVALRPVVLRPPLVFAANAKANFARLLHIADTALPLPFAGIGNKRSLISLSSLVAAIAAVLHAPAGRSGVFDVADDPPLSTPEIVAALRRGLGRPERLFRAPGLVKLAPRALHESLIADPAAFRQAYAWRGEEDVRDALAACAAAWKAAR